MNELKKCFLFFFNNGQIVFFLVIGFLNTVLTIALYQVIVTFLHYQIAFAISYLVGFLISFYFNSRFTYKSKLSLKKAFWFFFANVGGFFIGMIFNYIGIVDFKIHKRVMFLITSAILLGYNFTMGKIILEEAFKKKKEFKK